MTNRRGFSKALAIALVGVGLMSVLWVGVGAAEDIPILLVGRVEWIAGQVMVIGLEGAVIAAGGPAAINVDLSHVDQDEYHGLVTGDRVLVLVIGTVSEARDRVIATSVQRVPPYVAFATSVGRLR